MAQDINICGGCGEYDYECQCLVNKNRGGSQGDAPVEITCSDWLDANPLVAAGASSAVRKWCMENLAEMRAENRPDYYERVGILYDFLTDYLFKASQEQRRHPASSDRTHLPD